VHPWFDGQSCVDACVNYDLTALNGGASAQALCAWRDLSTGNYVYGTWFERAHEHLVFDNGYEGQACVFIFKSFGDYEDGTYYVTKAKQFYCGCLSSKWSYSWSGSTCATGSKAASTTPAICRVRKYRSAGPYVIGFYDPNTKVCNFPPAPFAADGSDISSVKGFNGVNWGMQALCAAPKATATAQICLTPSYVGLAKHCWLNLGGLTTGFYPYKEEYNIEGLAAGDPSYAEVKKGIEEKECAEISGTTVSKLRSALLTHYTNGGYEMGTWKRCDNNCCDFANSVLLMAGSNDVDSYYPWYTLINGPCN
jgi:hypothetical protein